MSEIALNVTTDELMECDRLYEEIDGQRVEVPEMSFFANWLGARIFGFLFTYSESHDVGLPTVESLFHLGPPVDRNRRPDVAFVSHARWPKGKPFPKVGNALDVTPNLMVEVISPTDLIEEVMTKLGEYFRAGAEQVWIAYPGNSTVQIFDSPTISRWLTLDDAIENIPFLPGFRLELRNLFVEHP